MLNCRREWPGLESLKEENLPCRQTSVASLVKNTVRIKESIAFSSLVLNEIKQVSAIWMFVPYYRMISIIIKELYII